MEIDKYLKIGVLTFQMSPKRLVYMMLQYLFIY